MLNFKQICIFFILSLLPYFFNAQTNLTNSTIFLKELNSCCPNPRLNLNLKSEIRILKEGHDFNHNSDDNNMDDDDFHDEIDDIDGERNSETAVTLRLYGNTVMGYYYVTLFFGSQLQRQNLIVDTGSTITTIPCTGRKTLLSFFWT